MWQEPPEPPKPKKKKTKTQLDEEGNEVIIELSEDESSDEEEQVNVSTIDMPTTFAKLTPILTFSPLATCHLTHLLGVASSSHCKEYSAILCGGRR